MSPTQTPVDLAVMETLERRFKARVSLAISLARAYRFALELEPFVSSGRDPFVEAATALRAWRAALRKQDAEGALDAIERTWPALEACRARVMARDAAIEAFRVRWACENAPLRHQTVDALARFYRLLPLSSGSQSKYEYVLTRRLAGPIGPERRLAPTEELRDAVRALEASWGATPVVVDEGEVAMVIGALRSFANEAASQPDAARFTSSAVLRRFGAFKASIGDQLFDPRVSVAVVETNVAVLNVLNQLLADAGGQPIRGKGVERRAFAAPRSTPAAAPPQATEPGPAPGPSAVPTEASPAEGSSRTEPVVSPTPVRDRADLRTGEIDLSGLELIRSMRKAATPSAGPTEGEESAAAPPASDMKPGADVDTATALPDSSAQEEPPPPRRKRPDLRTGEVDLSGLELDRLRKQFDAATQGGNELAPPATPASAEQQPSGRAFALAQQAENAAIIERYLAAPRSPEVWQLDLDFFLAPPVAESDDGNHATDRRRALELILDSDDLICALEYRLGEPPAEHRAQVRTIANAMLVLRTSLRRAADAVQEKAGAAEPLLYVADHLLWERLRLEASLKRKPSRQRAPVLPKRAAAQEPPPAPARPSARSLGFLVRAFVGAVAIATLVALSTISSTAPPVDPDVTLVQVAGLPGAAVFDEARAFKTTLYVTATRTWLLLGREERRAIVRGLGAFAVQRGLDAVSVVGPKGEPWATFKADEVLLDGDLSVADLAAR